MLRTLLRYFFSGTLFIVPLVATIYFIWVSFEWLDNLIDLPYPGLGVLIILAAITAFGYLTSGFALKTLVDWFDALVNKIPLVKIIYSSVKDLIGAFVGDKKKFDKPVLVRMSTGSHLCRIGFVVQSDLKDLGLNDMVAVYIPQSYAVAGDHYLISRENITPLSISGPAAMKFIVSGGVSGLRENS
ncbi:MAG: DUF502 domain-containing protein [Bacteroidetes bacterium]|nr:DUF502 domain-containing protein [Bacteroidota bacterium]